MVEELVSVEAFLFDFRVCLIEFPNAKFIFEMYIFKP